MADKGGETDFLRTAPDTLRRLGARIAVLEDKVEVYEHRRTTWVPSKTWENLSGRQREVVYVALYLVAMYLTKRLANRPITP